MPGCAPCILLAAETNPIIRVKQARGLAYPGLTIIVWASGTIPVADSVLESARMAARSSVAFAGVVPHVEQEDAAPRITVQTPIVASFLTHLSFSKLAILLAQHNAREPRSNPRTICPTDSPIRTEAFSARTSDMEYDKAARLRSNRVLGRPSRNRHQLGSCAKSA
jgi:hypothetical protein